jgi:Transposase IS4
MLLLFNHKTCAATVIRKRIAASFLLYKQNLLSLLFFANSLTMDPCCAVGALIMAKACHVISISECSRQFGANKAPKMFEGIVVEVITTTNSTSNQTTTHEQDSWLDPKTAVHGMDWFVDNDATLHKDNGSYHVHDWGVKTPVGDILRRGSNIDKRLSQLDVFLLLLTPAEHTAIPFNTNTNLDAKNYQRATKGEILRFLVSLFLFQNSSSKTHASLLSTNPSSKYDLAPAFCRPGMSRKRFDLLWECIQWSHQPRLEPPGMSSERFRWQHVDDFVKNWNEHQAKNFVPSECIWVDESISR